MRQTRGHLLGAALGLLVLALAGCTSMPEPVASKAPEPVDGPPDGPHADLALLPDPIPRQEPHCRPCFRPYSIAGRRYTPLAKADGYRQRGTASWYGRKFHGRPTATGEPFDMYALTAAHATLPIPSYAEVTNLDNGKRVVVRVNDRGPFKDDRLIDLSYAAAVRLGMVDDGRVPVEVTALRPGNRGTRPLAADDAVLLQVGAFSDRSNASRLQDSLAASGFTDVAVQPASVDGKQWHRVTIGPLSRDAAGLAASRLMGLGLAAPRLLVP